MANTMDMGKDGLKLPSLPANPMSSTDNGGKIGGSKYKYVSRYPNKDPMFVQTGKK